MRQPEHLLKRVLLACGALVVISSAQGQASGDANVPPATARQQAGEIARGDPARWHREDATPAARLRTIRKESAAGLQENLGVCRASPAPERAACVKRARATYRLEMAGAAARAAGGGE